MTQAPYLSSAEVCAVLQIDRSTLTRWVASGKIAPAWKLPGLRGAFVFDPSDVEALANHRKGIHRPSAQRSARTVRADLAAADAARAAS